MTNAAETEPNLSLLEQLGNPEDLVLHDLNFQHYRGGSRERTLKASPAQLRRLLRSVPDLFPEDFQSPLHGSPDRGYGRLFLQEAQVGVLNEIGSLGPNQINVNQVEAIIRRGVMYRNFPQSLDVLREQLQTRYRSKPHI